MLASKRNRSARNVDNPMDADGFYDYMKPKLRRRALRHMEKDEWQREARRALQETQQQA